jgi:hypothetical protein
MVTFVSAGSYNAYDLNSALFRTGSKQQPKLVVYVASEFRGIFE